MMRDKEQPLFDTERYVRAEEPGKTAFPIAKAGYPFIMAAAFATSVFAILKLMIPALIGLAATFFICYFFRDPDRLVPKGDDMVVSPADGKIIVITRVNSNPFIEGEFLKIGIFMSLFDVHINRSPFEGDIKKISYFPGKFLAANREKASTINEQNALILQTKRGIEFCIVQIAGLIARRIICLVQPGDNVKRGQRIGLICFGSRVDVYLPLNTMPTVAVGDKVKAGASILGYLS